MVFTSLGRRISTGKDTGCVGCVGCALPSAAVVLVVIALKRSFYRTTSANPL